MATRFLQSYKKEIIASNDSTVQRINDQRSYCANSDLFHSKMEPVAVKHLSKEEYKRQADCYR